MNETPADALEAMNKENNRLWGEVNALNRKISALQEQLEIARTSAKDSDEFRAREKKHAEAMMTGMRLAVMAMAEGMKS